MLDAEQPVAMKANTAIAKEADSIRFEECMFDVGTVQSEGDGVLENWRAG